MKLLAKNVTNSTELSIENSFKVIDFATEPIAKFITEPPLPNFRPVLALGNALGQTFDNATNRIAQIYLKRLETKEAEIMATEIKLVDNTEPVPSRIPLLGAKEIAMVTPYGDLDLAPQPGEETLLPPGERLKLYFKPEREVNTITATMLFTTSLSIEPHELKFIFVKAAEAAPAALAKEYIVDETFYQDGDGDGVWEASVVLPVVGGDYAIETVVDYVDGIDETFKREFLIDPEGYIFRKAGDDEARLSDVTVTIYQKHEDKGSYLLWNAGRYDQINPQVTNRTGEYSFLVPAGTYQITAFRKGFRLYESEELVVTRSTPVHLNIELKKASIFDIFR